MGGKGKYEDTKQALIQNKKGYKHIITRRKYDEWWVDGHKTPHFTRQQVCKTISEITGCKQKIFFFTLAIWLRGLTRLDPNVINTSYSKVLLRTEQANLYSP